jgi:hypothetical protein
LLNLTFQLSLDLLRVFSVSADLNGELRLRLERDLLVARNLRWRFSAPSGIVGNLHINITAILKVANQRVVRTGKEGVEFRRYIL